jgi:urease accessory protein
MNPLIPKVAPIQDMQLMSIDRLAMIRLMTWLSPAFPVGAFSYSHGLEYAVHDDTVTSRHALAEWIEDLIGAGSLWNDAVLLTEAWHAMATADLRRLRLAAEWGEAMAASAERRLETMDQGRSFHVAMRPWMNGFADADLALPYPVAVGAAAAVLHIDREAANAAFLHACAANLVSAGIRLIPLGQSEGTALLAALEDQVITYAHRAARSSLADLGSASFAADMASMRHEVLAVRLFRS